MLEVALDVLARLRTLPFSVVAAKSLASAVVPEADNMECVVFHASGLNTHIQSVRLPPDGCTSRHNLPTSGTSPGTHVLAISDSAPHYSAW